MEGPETQNGREGPERRPPCSTPSRPRLNRYRLIRTIGRGFSGVTYRARRLKDERLVALKVFDHYLSFEEDFKNTCIRGAFAAKTLEDPTALSVIECAEDNGRLIQASELIEGEPLARMLQRNIRFGERDTARLLSVLVRLVRSAGACGLHHGNLHPGKVMIANDGKPVVLGMGLPAHERLFRSEDPHPDGYTWPLAYQAPERLELSPAPPGEASNLYSIGAIGYHMLTGHPPFHSEHLPSLRIEKVSPIEWPQAPFKNEALRVLVGSLLTARAADRPSLAEAERVLTAAARGLQVAVKEGVPARIREPLPSAPLHVREAADKAPRRESPFMLPALFALLVLVVGMAALLKVFIYGPAPLPLQTEPDSEPVKVVVADTAQPPPTPPAPPAVIKQAPLEIHKSPTELAAQELKAIEEIYDETGELPPVLRDSLKRIHDEFPEKVWGIKASLILSRARQEEQRKVAGRLTELKARIRQALASYRVKDALAAIDDAEKDASASFAETLEVERSNVIVEMPFMYARVRTRAEILAASGDFAAAHIEYNKVLDGFPSGEWVSKTKAAVAGLKDIEERRAAEAAENERRKRDQAERTTYEAVLHKAYNAATRFRYGDATSAIEQGFAALTDNTFRQGLSIYREAIRSEAELFETVAGRLSRGEADVVLSFHGEGYLTIVGIGSSGVALRRENLEHTIYPWKRIDDYQKFRLFEKCVNIRDATEILALASVAFHRGMEFEAENNLSAAANLNPNLKKKSITWRGLFDELETLLRPVRARSQ